MKRYSLVPLIGTGTLSDMIRPDMSAATVQTFVVLATIAGRAVIRQTVPDGTATSAVNKNITVCDLIADESDFDQTVLTSAQITAITNWLTANHPTFASQFTAAVAAAGGTITRKQLARWILSTLMNRADIDDTTARTGFDAT